MADVFPTRRSRRTISVAVSNGPVPSVTNRGNANLGVWRSIRVALVGECPLLRSGFRHRVAAYDVTRILSYYQETGVLVLGWSRAVQAVRTYLDAGARGYLVIDHAMESSLIEAVRTVAQGHVWDQRVRGA